MNQPFVGGPTVVEPTVVGPSAIDAWVVRPTSTRRPKTAHDRLAPGMRADIAVVEGTGVERLAHRPGHDPVTRTYVASELVTG